MRLGLLAYGLDRGLTGIGRYTLELGSALAELAGGPAVTLLAAGGTGPLGSNGRLKQVSLPGCRLLPALLTLGSAWIPLRARQLGLDLVHDPTGVTPLFLGAGGARTVVTLHDVFPWSCPGHSSFLDTLIHRKWLPRVLPRVGAVITDSHHSSLEIRRYLDVPAERLRVVLPGIAPRFRPVSRQDARSLFADRLGLQQPFVLYVGALTLRKNIERALQAFAMIEGEFPSLRFVLAGPRSWKQTPVEKVVEQLRITDKVLVTGPLTDADLPALYSGADLFVFPSLYEGFGLPPLEAMACGTPVVCSNAASLPEVAGDAALMVDPYDVEALAEAMQRVLANRDLADDLRRRGLERAAGFTWERTARETMAVYREVCG